jgi:lysozyme family protein
MSMDAFNTAFNNAVGLEGKYSSDENDPGNWTGGAVNSGTMKGTMYGISAAAYPNEDIAGLSLAKVKSIYLTDYWNKLRCSTLPDPISIALFCEAINLGVSGAVKVLQRSLKSSDADGVMGQITIGMATAHGVKEVLIGFLTECAVEYTQMTLFKQDGHGWLSRVIKTALEVDLSPEENAGASGVKP